MPEITIQTADGATRRVPLAKERITIGRSRENDIFLPDQWLSRHHAEIWREAQGFALKDLGSKNGTNLNGARLGGQQLLRDGDVISLGEHTLTFRSTPAEDVEEDLDPIGTRIYPVKELSDVSTKPGLESAAELVRQNRLLAALSQAAKGLVEHRPLNELFERILNLLLEAVPAERAAILLLEGKPAQLVIKASRSRVGAPIHKVSRSIAKRALEQRVSLLLPNLLEDAAFRSQDSIMASGIRQALCAPLWFAGDVEDKDAVIGLVYLDSLQRAEAFGEDDLRIVTALANIAAAKIENTRLLEESLEKRAMEEDMRKAAEIQRRLLPDEAPRVEGYGLAGSNRPCHTIGGDYFDYLVDQGHLHMALGDVSGKGTSAALIMTVLRAAVRAHWTEFAPAEAVARINRTVCQNVPEGKYATFVMARLDPATGVLSYVNAGHNPPLLIKADGSTVELTEGGTVLGMFTAIVYTEASVTMQPGDALVIFSDGVTETWDHSGAEFGEQRLAQVVVRGRSLDADALQMRILSELDDFAKGAKATDDRTLIVLKRY
jgi:serine phosphatase RsbU (regulator of sigma subunit)/pSer/pThr/pTyr-binding forkhead associated (FHA) protein